MINKHIYTTLFIKTDRPVQTLSWYYCSKTDSLESADSRVYSAVKVNISEWYPSCQLLMIHVLGLTEAVLCLLIVSTMHAIIKTSNVLIKKKKRTNGKKVCCEVA